MNQFLILKSEQDGIGFLFVVKTTYTNLNWLYIACEVKNQLLLMKINPSTSKVYA